MQGYPCGELGSGAQRCRLPGAWCVSHTRMKIQMMEVSRASSPGAWWGEAFPALGGGCLHCVTPVTIFTKGFYLLLGSTGHQVHPDPVGPHLNIPTKFIL